jgi:hypothetical protein
MPVVNSQRPSRLAENYSEAGDANDDGLEEVGAGDVLEAAAGTGAPLPAVSEPRPILFSEIASIFPVGLMPFLS